MTRVPLQALALLAAALPAIAEAQTTPEGPGKVQQIRAVERGGFVEADVGLGMFVKSPGTGDYGLSVVTGVYAGYDVLPVLSISIGALALAAPVQVPSAPLPGGGQPGPVARDLLYLSPMLQVQLALVTTERNFLYVRGAAGFGFTLPSTLGDANGDGTDDDYGGMGPMFGATVGFERFTKLRHFSLGIQAGALIVTKPDLGIGLTLTPTLKYTF
ncbi:adventurous gliding motility protein CglE [Myxococcota bacterium]|nr:adventurous gliding motility protein CglE [Myxococcota bacterium]